MAVTKQFIPEIWSHALADKFYKAAAQDLAQQIDNTVLRMLGGTHTIIGVDPAIEDPVDANTEDDYL